VTRLALVLVALVGAITSGCLTTPASATGATAKARELSLPSCPGGVGKVEDAEDKDSRINQVDGRGGYWFTFVDSEGSTVKPTSPFMMADGGPEGSQAAARVSGKMAPTGSSIYAGMGFKLLEGPGTYDASRFSGIRFKAKGPGKVRFEIPDGNTAPDGGVCTACYNDFGVALAFTDQWETYTVSFDDLAQQPGWGDRQPEIDKSRLSAVEWQFGSAGRDFDIWVDDVEFVGCDE
jgi:hypothetical protein